MVNAMKGLIYIKQNIVSYKYIYMKDMICM